MDLLIRFSRRLWTFAVLILLLAGISLTANDLFAQNGTSKKPVPIEGAFGYKLGETFKTGGKLVKGSLISRLFQGNTGYNRNYFGHDSFVPRKIGKKIIPKVYEVKPPKPVYVLQRYFVYITPKTHQIYQIIGYASFANDKQESQAASPLALVLRTKYHEKTFSQYFHDHFSIYTSGNKRIVLSGPSVSVFHGHLIGVGNPHIALVYTDETLLSSVKQTIQKMEKTDRLKKAEETNIDPSAL